MRHLYAHIFAPSRLRLWILIVGCFFSLVALEEVVDDVFHDPLEGDFEAAQFDQAVTQWIYTFRSPALNDVMRDLTALGSISVILTLFVVFASVVATYRDFRGLTFLGFILTGAGLWPFFLKPYFARARPEATEQLVTVLSHSFPSGHTFGATAVYTGLAFYAGRYARSWGQEVFFYCLGGVIISLVGISRIYLGAHFPTDVLGGLSAGAAWGFFVAACYEALAYHVPEKPNPVIP